jgi:hypothetical protein
MAIWQHTFYIDIGNKEIKKKDIFPALDKFLKRDWSGEELQCWEEPSSNDILVTWEKETDLIDENITVRIDVGNIQIDFIQWTIASLKNMDLN